ncbi:MAG: TfoX family protein [Planctomycetaceae bacterium]|nr:MAG: TfoX family protein [Planctomycetaceae bacterium]
MAYSDSLARRVRHAMAQYRGSTEKKMFGSLALLLNGNMCVGVWKSSLIVRLGPEQAETALKEAHVVEFDVTGRPMRGWVVVEADGLETDDQLSGWVQRAVRFVEGLPCK